MAQVLADEGYAVHVIEWDRSGQKPKVEVKNKIVFKRLTLRAANRLRIFCLVPVWILYSFIQILIGNYRIVQPQNLDCLIQTFLATRCVRHGRIVYDLADFYRDAYVVSMPIVSPMCAILEKQLIRRVDAAILVSERQVLQVEARNLPEKVVLFYNVPDVNLGKSNNADLSRTVKNEDCFTLFYAGILGYDRVSLLMNVICAIRDLPVKILIAGFGEYERSLHCLSETNRQLTFLGRLDHEDVIQCTMRADVVLLPYDSNYVNNRIGLPNKFFEAMTLGKLVLAPDNTYMGEIVTEEKTGFVVDYHSAKELHAKIQSMVHNDEKVTLAFGRNARRLYKERFDLDKLVSNYRGLVQSLV